MKRYRLKTTNPQNNRGGVLVLVALLLAVFLGIAAFAIDIGYINTTKNQLQNVADAAALAGTGKLGDIYFLGGAYDSDAYSTVSTVVDEVAEQNKAAGLNISIIPDEIVAGKWDGAFTSYADDPVPPNAVKVTARRDTTSKAADLQGSITSFFAGIVGIDSFGVSADAVAALSGQAEFEPGEIKLPIAISEFQFPDACQNPVIFNTNTDCTAWHMFDPEGNINANDLGDVLLGLIVDHEEGQQWLEDNGFKLNKIPDSFITPGVVAGEDEFNLTEGGNSSMFTSNENMPIPPMEALFEFFKTRDIEDPELTKIENDKIWITTIPVYQEQAKAVYPNCVPTGANESHLIVGAADIKVFAVNGPPDKSLDVEIDCNKKQLRGGGGFGGNLGTIPNLVE
jgi:hypothetical protein